MIEYLEKQREAKFTFDGKDKKELLEELLENIGHPYRAPKATGYTTAPLQGWVLNNHFIFIFLLPNFLVNILYESSLLKYGVRKLSYDFKRIMIKRTITIKIKSKSKWWKL